MTTSTRDRDDFDIYDGRWIDDPRGLDDRDRDFERDTDPRSHDPCEPFVDGLELPRGPARELVQDERENLYELNREDSLTLVTVGAFRVVAERDLEGLWDDDALEHLRDEGLIGFVAINEDERAVVLTRSRPSRLLSLRCPRRRQCSSLRFDRAFRAAFGH